MPTCRIKAHLALVGFFVLLTGLLNAAEPMSGNAIQETLRNRIESAGQPVRIHVGEELIHAEQALPEFYESLLWITLALFEQGMPHRNCDRQNLYLISEESAYSHV